MIVVCGEALFDVFAVGDTPTGVTLDAGVGGSPFNVAVGLARLAQPECLLTRISRDFLGERLMRTLHAEGVNTTTVQRGDAPTTLGLMRLDDRGVPSYSFYGRSLRCAPYTAGASVIPTQIAVSVAAAMSAFRARPRPRRSSMKIPSLRCAPALLAATTVIVSVAAAADDSRSVRANLSGYQEVASSLNTQASGRFDGKFSGDTMSYELSYSGLPGVTQAHIHFGAKGTNGGISVFLCSNLGNGPAGTPPCPPGEGTISGTMSAADVLGPAGQGLMAGDFGALARAIRAGIAYVNVHSTSYPGGEIRGQINNTP
jgi:hypothetical protein